MFYSLIATLSTLAYTTQNVQFEPQDPGDIGTGVTENSISQYSGLGNQDPVDVTVMVINWLLGLLGIFFLVLVLYGGFLWMTAAGTEDRIDKAKKIITAAVIGLVIILASYGITYFVFEVIVNSTNGHF